MLKRLVLTIIVSVSCLADGLAEDTYKGSSFDEVWGQVTSNEYPLPSYRVSFRSLFKGGRDLISRAANRTLTTREDLLERMNGRHYPNKLAHPNGICLSGSWSVTQENPYSGMFKKGARGLIIARASTALTRTRAGEKRAFGFAGKLFPTMDSSQVVKTGNFFTVDNLGGTNAKYFSDVSLTNAPESSNPGFKLLAYAMELAQAFTDADDNPGVRQMYEVSELGLKEPAIAITPKRFMVRAKPGTGADFADFRDELRVENNSGKLKFEILVNDNTVKGLSWVSIGEIVVNQSIVSESCDRQLHFHHPKWKKLKH